MKVSINVLAGPLAGLEQVVLTGPLDAYEAVDFEVSDHGGRLGVLRVDGDQATLTWSQPDGTSTKKATWTELRDWFRDKESTA